MTPENAAVWNAACEADEQAFKINKLILLAVVLTMLAAACTFGSGKGWRNRFGGCYRWFVHQFQTAAIGRVRFRSGEGDRSCTH